MEVANIRTLADFEADDRYVKDRGIPVFAPHSRHKINPLTKRKSLVYTVTDADLEEICALSNEQARESIHLSRQTIGHVKTTDEEGRDIPEQLLTAELIGFAANYRVGVMPGSMKKVILADFYTEKSKAEAAKRFPYRSAEYNYSRKRISGVARLLRDPALGLGTMCCESPDRIFEYADAMKEQSDDSAGSDIEQEPGKEKPRAEDSASIEPELNPDEVVAANRLWSHFKKCYPGLASLEAAVASGTNTDMPDKDQRPEPERAPEDDQQEPEEEEEEDDMADLAKLQADLDAVIKERDALREQVEKANIDSHITSLALYEFDLAEVTEDLKRRDGAGREKYVASMKKSLRLKDGQTSAPISVLEDHEGVEGGKADKGMSREKMVQAQKWLALNHGKSWTDAMAAVGC